MGKYCLSVLERQGLPAGGNTPVCTSPPALASSNRSRLLAAAQTVGLLPTHCAPAMDSPVIQAAYVQSAYAYVEV